MMKHIFSLSAAACLLLIQSLGAIDLPNGRLAPDTLILNDGSELHGLILKNDAKGVILQQRMGEVTIPKARIRRIMDEGDALVYFADIADSGKLPPWRMIVQDLRADDNIRSFRQVPATTIDNGRLRNIPYLSFRVNKRTELNVYGNPEDPVCLEFGVYGKGLALMRFKNVVRAYLAGILTSRDEISALYGISDRGGVRKVGKFTFEVTPQDAPDSYGGWWISIYDANRLDRARVSDEEYRKNTLPFHVVNDSRGELRVDRQKNFDKVISGGTQSWSEMIPDLRGFYRDSMGDLKLLTVKATEKLKQSTSATTPRH
jgi:hypothetical protein